MYAHDPTLLDQSQTLAGLALALMPLDPDSKPVEFKTGAIEPDSIGLEFISVKLCSCLLLDICLR